MSKRFCCNPFSRHTKKFFKTMAAISPSLYDDLVLYFPDIEVPPPKSLICLRCKFYASHKLRELKEAAILGKKRKPKSSAEVKNNIDKEILPAKLSSTKNSSTTSPAIAVSAQRTSSEAGIYSPANDDDAVEDEDADYENEAVSEVSVDGDDEEEPQAAVALHPSSPMLRVTLTREPEVEEAVQRAMRRSSQRLKSSSTTNKINTPCFICGVKQVFPKPGKYNVFKKQTMLFKSLVMKPPFKSTISAALCQEIEDENMLDCCAKCLLDIKRASSIKQQIQALQNEIKDLVGRARTKIKLRNSMVEEAELENNAADTEEMMDTAEDSQGLEFHPIFDNEFSEANYDSDFEDVKPFSAPVFEDVLDSLNKNNTEAAVTTEAEDKFFAMPTVRRSKMKATENLRKSLKNFNEIISDLDSDHESENEVEDDKDEEYIDNSDERSLICPECGKKYPTRRLIKNHINSAHYYTKKVYVCEECGKRCKSERQLAFHKNTVHNPNAETFSCPKCDLRFYEKKKLYIHKVTSCQLSVDQEEMDLYKINFHQCDKCDRKFLLSRDLARHIASHTGIKPFPCTKCRKAFATKNNLKVHENTICGAEVNAEFKKKVAEERKKKYLTGKKTRLLKCSKCPSRFSTEKHRQKHEETTCLSLKSQWICELCGKSYTTQLSMNNHIKRVHNEEKHFSCHYCQKKFFDQVSCKKHIQNIHEKDTNPPPARVKNQECNLCPRKFHTRYLVNLHKQRVHLNMKKFKCEICEKMFFDWRNMNRHMKTHQKQKDNATSDEG